MAIAVDKNSSDSIDWEGLAPSQRFVQTFPISFSRRQQVIGLEDSSGKFFLASSAVGNVVDTVRRLMDCPVIVIETSLDQIGKFTNQAYETYSNDAQAFIGQLDNDPNLLVLNESADLLEFNDRSPVVKVVNAILFDAIKSGASDVHFQPSARGIVARLRIDGVLFDAFELPRDMQEEIVSRVKVLGAMNIAEKRLPQDGRASVRLGERLVDLRISSLPSSAGERIVIRLLDKSTKLYSLGEIGMERQLLSSFQHLIKREHGLILVTGPTGSGKTTTLYAALQEINVRDKNVLTLEDPIEYELAGISQTQVSEKKGLTFASGLRTVLRQDPDIIMVGEIRDAETADMAIQSALTGHLVFSTLHTNDAAGAISRLLDLGAEPFLVASSLVGVLAQRLVRRICPACKQVRNDPDPLTHRFGLTPETTLFSGAGCVECRQTGYRGRLGLFEFLEITDSIREQIQHRANATQIRQIAQKRDFRLLSEDGLSKASDGLTTLDELSRVASASDS